MAQYRSLPEKMKGLPVAMKNGIELFDVTTLSLQTLFRKRTTADLGVPVLLSVARFARWGFWCCTRDADKIQNGVLATERGSGAMKVMYEVGRIPPHTIHDNFIGDGFQHNCLVPTGKHLGLPPVVYTVALQAIVEIPFMSTSKSFIFMVLQLKLEICTLLKIFVSLQNIEGGILVQMVKLTIIESNM
ncbi:hypothetical protein BYT27DRAFT_7207116 [Phlegmacium glaucopus]|nr:hypothetical protein BYT27DRAFT_7207116 [Phlegmacium glaucopus]